MTYLIRFSIIKITSMIFLQGISSLSTYTETSNLFDLFRLVVRKLINDSHFKLKRRNARCNICGEKQTTIGAAFFKEKQWQHVPVLENNQRCVVVQYLFTEIGF